MFDDESLVPDETLFREVRLGEDTKVFLKTNPMGKMLAERATDMYKKAVSDFERLSVTDIRETPWKVLEIKNNMDLAKMFMSWVNDTITTGDRAVDSLRIRDDQDASID